MKSFEDLLKQETKIVVNRETNLSAKSITTLLFSTENIDKAIIVDIAKDVITLGVFSSVNNTYKLVSPQVTLASNVKKGCIYENIKSMLLFILDSVGDWLIHDISDKIMEVYRIRTTSANDVGESEMELEHNWKCSITYNCSEFEEDIYNSLFK